VYYAELRSFVRPSQLVSCPQKREGRVYVALQFLKIFRSTRSTSSDGTRKFTILGGKTRGSITWPVSRIECDQLLIQTQLQPRFFVKMDPMGMERKDSSLQLGGMLATLNSEFCSNYRRKYLLVSSTPAIPCWVTQAGFSFMAGAEIWPLAISRIWEEVLGSSFAAIINDLKFAEGHSDFSTAKNSRLPLTVAEEKAKELGSH